MRGWPGPTTCLLDGVLNRNGRFSNDDVEYSISPSELWGDGAGRLRDEYLLFRQKQQQDTARSVRVRNLIDGTIRARVIIPLAPAETPMMTVWRDLGGTIPPDPLVPGGPSGPFSCQNRDVDVMPLLVALRPFSSASALDVKACDVVDEAALVNGILCIKLRIDHRGALHMGRALTDVDFWWIDPKRDFIVVKWRDDGSPSRRFRSRSTTNAIATMCGSRRAGGSVWPIRRTLARSMPRSRARRSTKLFRRTPLCGRAPPTHKFAMSRSTRKPAGDWQPKWQSPRQLLVRRWRPSSPRGRSVRRKCDRSTSPGNVIGRPFTDRAPIRRPAAKCNRNFSISAQKAPNGSTAIESHSSKS